MFNSQSPNPPNPTIFLRGSWEMSDVEDSSAGVNADLVTSDG